MSSDPRYPRHSRSGRQVHPARARLMVLILAALALVAVAAVVGSRRDKDEPAMRAAGASGGEATGEPGGATAATDLPTTQPTTTTSSFPPPVTNAPLPEEPGVAPVITHVDTNDPVVFLTIDDGLTRQPEFLTEFDRLNMPASLFMINEPIESDPEYFRSMPGTLIESHTQSHMNLRGQPLETQQQEICGNADRIEQIYGRRPVLFRPPGGNYDNNTKVAAANCGMKAVVIWAENVNWDVVGFREVQHFRPGDIILMHFRPQFVQELNVIKQRVEEAGFRFALLEDYLAPETVPANLTR